MDSATELQDLYSSTSSDDQSSINSVVHVDAVLDLSESDTTSDSGLATTSGARERQNNGNGKDSTMDGAYHSGQESDSEDGHYHTRQVEFLDGSDMSERHQNSNGIAADHSHYLMEGEDDSSSEDEDEERMRREEEQERARDSDTSTTSEDTQIWVQHSKPRSHHATPSQRPSVPPKPGLYHGTPGTSSGGGATGKRQSLVSQSSSGRVETRLLVAEEATAGDSGLSTESPTHSTQGDIHDPHGVRTYIHYQPDPHTPPHSSTCPMTSSVTSSQHPLGPYYQQPKRTSLGLYQHSSPSHQSSRESPVITLQALHSPSPSPIPPTMLIGNGEPSSQSVQSPLSNGTHISENLFNILSFLYAMLLVVMGTSFPLAEIFTRNIPFGVFEAFYIYLFVVSIFFLIYVYLFLLRSSTSNCCRRRRLRHDDTQREDTLLNQSLPWRQKAVTVSNQNHTGSFYLRLGAVGFGIGSLIHEGLMFGQQFETELIWKCINIAMVIRPVAQLMFTFVQLYFIFLNSKMLIHKYKIFARFGLMHMIATNICVWLRVVISETVREVQGHPNYIDGQKVNVTQSPGSVGGQDSAYNTNKLSNSVRGFDEVRFMYREDVSTQQGVIIQTTEMTPTGTTECLRLDIMGHVVKSASPYLYPCTIQYSLIAAGILLIMWRNIGTPAAVTPSSYSDSENDIQRHKKNNRVSVDCSGANRGLFFGIFTLVGIIISMIVFFVLVKKPGFKDSAVIVTHSSEIVLYFLASLAVIIAAVRVRQLKFHRDRDNALEELLLIISLCGVYIFALFNIVAGKWFLSMKLCGPLVIASNILVIFQATAQTVFIMNGLRRSALSNVDERRKPGREFVTFLLVCNVAMWGMNTFEVLRASANPVSVTFFGNLAWNIVTHITTPLVIFYRFHSVVCLATIWRSAYKLKLH